MGPRVLMLGWEYPPLFAGGLGKASQGLAQGLADCGAEVMFVLPQRRGRSDAARLRVAGVEHWLRSARGALRHGRRPRPGVRSFAVPARLFPYQPSWVGPAALAAADAADDPLRQLYGEDLGREVTRFAARVARLARRLDADFVHANDWMSFPAAFAAAGPRNLPVFLHVHSTEYDRSGEAVNPWIADIERRAFAKAAHVFAVSRYTANVLIARYGVPREKITVVHNAPDAPPQDGADSLPGAERAPWVVFLGRLTFQKGPDHFLRAAARVAALNHDARFLVCGSGDMLEGLRNLAQALGIRARVRFPGFLQPAMVDRVLSRSRVLVMSSVSEPFGLVALEALRNGTPVIVSKQSGVREVLGHSLEVDFWDHDRLADQILALLRLPVLGRQLVDSGRGQLANLSWRDSARVILATCARVCAVPPDRTV